MNRTKADRKEVDFIESTAWEMVWFQSYTIFLKKVSSNLQETLVVDSNLCSKNSIFVQYAVCQVEFHFRSLQKYWQLKAKEELTSLIPLPFLDNQ